MMCERVCVSGERMRAHTFADEHTAGHDEWYATAAEARLDIVHTTRVHLAADCNQATRMHVEQLACTLTQPVNLIGAHLCRR